MADLKAVKAHVDDALKHLRESSAASFSETYVSKAVQSLENAVKAMDASPAPVAAAPATPAPAKPAFTAGKPVVKK